MELPVDLKALFDEATDIQAARDMQLSVSVYVDETAPSELTAHIRGAFASSMSNVRMALSYLDKDFNPREGDDIAVIVAADSAKIGAASAVLRALEVPVMVVTLSPTAVGEKAEKLGHPIPDGDLVAPSTLDEEQAEPIVFDDDARDALNDRMGRWIVAVCRDKRLAFAIAFPFIRRPLAIDAVQATSLQNAGIGLIPLIPGADLPIMTLNQGKMVLQIAAAYGHEMDKGRLKELAAVVGSAYVCRTLARGLAEFIPILGFAIRTGVAYGGTSALGYAIINYYEGGENATGVANVAEHAAQASTKFVANVRGLIDDSSSSKLVGKAGAAVSTIRRAADDYIPVIRDKVGEQVPKAVDFVTGVVNQAVR